MNTGELLVATAARLSGYIHAENIFQSASLQGEGRISRVMESIFRADDVEQIEGGDTYYGEWCDIGSGTAEE